ncbi:MAG: Fe-S cluster assembly protein SufD [Rhizobiales bacterium]|nr:Fe-S cluster assembly protein SufD [Hyphomicrobiales bacterium]
MNVEVRAMRTAAEQALVEAFAAAKDRLPGGDAVAAMRVAAIKNFETTGLPHRRVEEWKYTDLRALMRDANPLAAHPDAAAKARAKSANKLLSGIDCHRLVFVDGAFAPDLSDLDRMDKGLTVHSLAMALAARDGAVIDELGRAQTMSSDPAVSLNTAFMGDGAVIHVAAGARITHPLHLVFVTAGGMASAMFTRSLVVIGSRAQLTLIESHEGPEAVDYQGNHALELIVGDEAEVDHLKLIGEGAGALHISTLLAEIGAHATFNEFSFISGGAVVRYQLSLRFAGEGTNADIRGARLLRGRQHADTTMVVDHTAAGCTSREMFKSVLDGESRGIFQGKIIVRPGAQRTDAKMMTQALLLSENAEADNKPELEIFADDVQCGHGATAGELDKDMLFYLKARGIPAKEAEALLIQAFVGEAIEGVRHEGVRDILNAAAAAWLTARG